MIDHVEFSSDFAHFFYQLWWLQDGAMFAVTDKSTAGFEKVGDAGGDGRGTVRVRFYGLPGKVLAYADTGNDRAESILEYVGDRRRSIAHNCRWQHPGATRENIVKTETKLFLVIEAPTMEIDVSALEYQGLRFDHMTAFFPLTRGSMAKFQLLTSLYGLFNTLYRLRVGVAVIGCFVQVDAVRTPLSV